MEPQTSDIIAQAIQRHRQLEVAIDATNPAIGRYYVKFGSEFQQMWLTNKENTGGAQRTHDITGQVRGTVAGNRTTITEDGFPVYKNQRLGEHLIRSAWEPVLYKTPKGAEIELQVFNSSNYRPCLEDFATDLTINAPEFKQPLRYRTLKEVLKGVEKLNQEINELEIKKEEASDEEVQGLLDEIEHKKEEKKKQLEKAQSFIRNHAELRYQPILDPWQEEVKRSKLFHGSLAINGGPGTGKTTSLIQRIKFLIDKEALIDYMPNLSPRFKDKLTNQKQSWIFFSPSELLSLYLKNSMTEEGLDASTERVKVWEEHKNSLVQQYKLFNTETQRPFLLLRSNKYRSKVLLPVEGTQLKRFVEQFDEFFFNSQREKIQKLVKFDLSKFEWKNLGQSIAKYISKQKEYTDVEQLVRLYNNMQENFSAEAKEINEEYGRLINRAAAVQLLKVRKEEATINQLKNLLVTLAQDKKAALDVEDQDEDDDIEDLDFDEIAEKSLDHEAILLTKLKTLIRKSALIKFDSNTKFTKNDRLFLEHVKELDQTQDLDKIGQLAFFKKHFEKVLKGTLRNIFMEVPKIYKQFRKDALKTGTVYQNNEVLRELVEKDSNKRLHPNEQSFLLYFINTLIKASYKVSQAQSNELNHPYLEAFRANSKPVIGIDEATDFHLIDLLAMSSFADPEISAVTYSGDLMQRLTTDGLRNWNDIGLFNTDFEVKDLVISYRQSHTLLNLAQAIYEKSTNIEADYISYLQEDETEPAPLVLVNEDEEEIIEWIGERIREIYIAYGNYIPSIAVFLPSEDGLDRFANALGEMDALADVGIQVKACKNGEVLGSKNTVRVFSINHIKGLEFEAVFFHNLDSLADKSDSELAIKNLYVGLSRATFYLAITSQNELPAKFSYLSDLLLHDGNWQI